MTPASQRPDVIFDPFVPYRAGLTDSPNPTNSSIKPVTGTDLSRQPAVEVTPAPRQGFAPRKNDGSVSDYWLSENFLRGMKPADAEGFRWVVGRRFVDVEYEGTLQTMHVALDEFGNYRGKFLTERTPSGPLLYKNDGLPTWRLTQQVSERPVVSPERQTQNIALPKRPAPPISERPDLMSTAKRPRPLDTPTYIDQSRYSPTGRSPDSQGYYELRPVFGSKDSNMLFAFRDQFANWVQVDPPANGFGSHPTHLKQWTDHQLWEVYGIEGQDIVRFRAQVQSSGRPAQWAEPRPAKNPVTDLLRNGLRWMLPDSNLTQRETFLQSFNLLPSQLIRLQRHLQTELTMPQWALAHKRLTEDINNPQRLDQLSRDAVEELNLKRNARHDWYNPETSMTFELREALLSKMGYLRNKYNCLYRTDIPALFRGDERTPFELANDDTMLPRYHHEPGATTHKPMSATFSLKEGQMYASAPDPEYLQFNSQTNKYPGRDADASDSDSHASDASDIENADSSDWSEADSPIAWDYERDYEPIRTRQKEMFLYALDTRNLEVVPHEENYLFNSAARLTPPTWFPSDDFEGLISVTRSGLEADRIWLLNSTLTKGAKVEDITLQAGTHAERIEAATHAGHRNYPEYDQLIDKVEAAGLPILRLSGNKNEFGHDITWPGVTGT